MYHKKYTKYTQKIHQIGGTFDKSFVLVDGTSIAGKPPFVNILMIKDINV